MKYGSGVVVKCTCSTLIRKTEKNGKIHFFILNFSDDDWRE